jgi:Domain of unknown function (DUF6268)
MSISLPPIRRAKNVIPRCPALPVLLLALSLALPAGMASAGSMAVSHELDVDLGLIGGATTLQNAQRVGSSRELDADVKYVISPQITNNLLLRIGAEWERVGFGTPGNVALPDALQQVNAIIGLDYQLADQWLMRAEVQPGIYGDFKQIGWRQFGAPVVVGLVYLRNEDLQWFFALRVDSRGRVPVFPVAGVRWKFHHVWTLDMQLPQPRLEYDLTDNLQAYVGAGIKAQTYVVGDSFGSSHGLPQLNGATVDFTEVRVGPGFTWKALDTLTLDAGAGCMLSRTWDFFDRQVKLNSHPAPYLQLSAHARF